MKKFLAAFVCMFLLLHAGAYAQTADEILSKHYEARGGLDKLKNLQSITMEGVLTQSGTEIAMKFYTVQNIATRVEFSVMGQTGYNIITQKEGWVFNPFAGGTSAESMPEEQVKLAKSQLDIQGPLVEYQAKGNKVEYIGQENLQGKDYFKIKLTNAEGLETVFYLDKDYLIARTVTKANVNGQEQEVVTEYADYRKTPEGLVVAYKRILGMGEINFEKIEINPKIDDGLFKPEN